MSDTLIESRLEGPVLHVTINRPQKRNALTPQMMDDLAKAICTSDERPDVRAVIVSAAGPIFSAGIDIASLAEVPGASSGVNLGRQMRRFAARLQHALNLIESTEVPIIGALHGQVLGLGFELALAFDLRVASSDLTLSIPEARLGLVADVGGTTRLARTVGPSRAKDLLLTARSIDATEALQWGLVNRVVPPNELRTSSVALAEQIARNAPMAVGMAKLIVDQGDGLDKETQMAIERWAQSQLLSTEDFKEAIQSFLQKRQPQFKGR
jgi:enoyl-CoA hydratase/carnithine racemase